MMRLGIDIDGVLANFNEAFIALIKEQTGIELPPVSATYPNTWAYHRAGGVTAKQDEKLWAFITDPTNAWHEAVGGLPGAEHLAHLSSLVRDDMATVYFITTRPGTTAHSQSRRWLEVRGMDHPQVLIAANEAAKGQLAAGLNLTAFIDDKTENCLAVAHAAPRCKTSILTQPYNRTVQFMPPITRVDSVSEWLTNLGLLVPQPSLLRQAMMKAAA